MDWRKSVHTAWRQQLLQGDYNTVGVLKFNKGTAVGLSTAQKLWCAYWRKLDRVVFGRAADKGAAVSRWCFVEGGEFGNNLHLHFVAQAPFETVAFCTVATALWSDFHTYASNTQYSQITPMQHNSAAVGYFSKETWLLKADVAGAECSRRAAPEFDCDSFQNQAQIQRIQAQITNTALDDAHTAVFRHILSTTERRQLRQRLAELRGIQRA